MKPSGAMLLVAMAAASPGIASDEAAIKAIEEQFASAWAAHDPVRLASFWAEDGDFMNPFGRFARSRKELQTLFAEEQQGIMKTSTYHFRLDSHRVLAPDVMVTDWTNEIRGMIAPTGQPLPPFPHHVTTVFVKRNGRWWKSAARSVALLPPPSGSPGK